MPWIIAKLGRKWPEVNFFKDGIFSLFSNLNLGKTEYNIEMVKLEKIVSKFIQKKFYSNGSQPLGDTLYGCIKLRNSSTIFGQVFLAYESGAL